jgi:hypothetical protein
MTILLLLMIGHCHDYIIITYDRTLLKHGHGQFYHVHDHDCTMTIDIVKSLFRMILNL